MLGFTPDENLSHLGKSNERLGEYLLGGCHHSSYMVGEWSVATP